MFIFSKYLWEKEAFTLESQIEPQGDFTKLRYCSNATSYSLALTNCKCINNRRAKRCGTTSIYPMRNKINTRDRNGCHTLLTRWARPTFWTSRPPLCSRSESKIVSGGEFALSTHNWLTHKYMMLHLSGTVIIIVLFLIHS